MLILQRHIVPKANGGERDEAVVIGMKEAPPFKMREGQGTHTQRAHAWYETDDHHVGHGDLGTPHAKALLQAMEQVPNEGVDPLTNALEHDQSERDAQEGVEHAEHLPYICAGGCMAISWGEKSRKEQGYWGRTN